MSVLTSVNQASRGVSDLCPARDAVFQSKQIQPMHPIGSPIKEEEIFRNRRRGSENSRRPYDLFCSGSLEMNFFNDAQPKLGGDSFGKTSFVSVGATPTSSPANSLGQLKPAITYELSSTLYPSSESLPSLSENEYDERSSSISPIRNRNNQSRFFASRDSEENIVNESPWMEEWISGMGGMEFDFEELGVSQDNAKESELMLRKIKSLPSSDSLENIPVLIPVGDRPYSSHRYPILIPQNNSLNENQSQLPVSHWVVDNTIKRGRRQTPNSMYPRGFDAISPSSYSPQTNYSGYESHSVSPSPSPRYVKSKPNLPPTSSPKTRTHINPNGNQTNPLPRSHRVQTKKSHNPQMPNTLSFSAPDANKGQSKRGNNNNFQEDMRYGRNYLVPPTTPISLSPSKGKLYSPPSPSTSPNQYHYRHKAKVSRHKRPNNKNDEELSRFEIYLDVVSAGEDNRTTLMIKNIPNKYDQEMLLETVNKKFKGTYDFFYLPIDFKNKCNVGYAFINFLSTAAVIKFVEEFNKKKWEKFNSEKVCKIAYARIQGKLSFIDHFRNSNLMYEDPSCRPLIFYSSGSNIGTPEPFPPALFNSPNRARHITNSNYSDNEN